MLNIRLVEGDAAERKIGTLYELQEIISRRIRIIDEIHGGVDDLAEIMRWDIGRHAHRDAERPVQKKIRQRGREHVRLLARRVVVGVPCDGLLFEVGEKRVSDARHLRFGVAHGRRTIAVD